jgi:hypothetical protein
MVSPALWWIAQACGLWLIAMGAAALVLLRREGALPTNVMVAIAIPVALPALALLVAPRRALRLVVGLLSAVVGVGLPVALLGAARDVRALLIWLACLAPLLVLLWARYRFLRRPAAAGET